MGRTPAAIALAAMLVLVAAPAAAEEQRETTSTYVVGAGPPAVTICSQGSLGDYGVGGVCLPVHDDETSVDVAIDDAVTATVCAHYTIYDEAGTTIGNGAFEDAATISLPAEADRLSLAIGDSHEDTATEAGLTDCPDRKGTVGQVQATFT